MTSLNDYNVQYKMHNKIIDANCKVNARKCLWKCDTFNTIPNTELRTANELREEEKNVHSVHHSERNAILMAIYDLLLYNCSIFCCCLLFFLQFNFMCIRLAIYRLPCFFLDIFCRSFSFRCRTMLIDMTLAILLLLLMFTFFFRLFVDFFFAKVTGSCMVYAIFRWMIEFWCLWIFFFLF